MTFPFYDYDSDFFSTEDLLFLAGASGKAVEDTATGNPLVFTTDLARPLKSLLIPFTPQQEGSGEPSPENIRSILPWNGLTVFGGGRNLLKLAETDMASSGWNRYFPNTLTKAGTYTISCKAQFGGDGEKGCKVALAKYNYNTSGNIIKDFTDYSFGKSSSGNYYSFTVTDADLEQGEYICFSGNSENMSFASIESGQIMIEAGQTATAYEPYKPITETDIVFPSPVYGGTLDVVSGVLTVEWGIKISDGSVASDWNCDTSGGYLRCIMSAMKFGDHKPKQSGALRADYFNFSSARSAWNAYISNAGFLGYVPPETVEDKTAWLEYLAQNPLTIVYELDEPYTVQLTPAQLTALVGDNTIWSDADGSMTAVYLKKG